MSGLKNKKILVTGGSGFIASHLTRRLVDIGADVAILTKYNSLIDNVRIVDVWDKITVIEADIRNQDSLTQIKAFEPDIVYHFAAYNHVGDSFLHVQESLDTNVKGTANVFEAYDDYERFIYIATSEVYGHQTSVPFQEDMKPNPVSPYSVGKYSGELYACMKMKEMNKPVVVLRPFNAFGPYQSPRAIIAEIIINCLLGKIIRSTEGIQTRDFNFVYDLVDGFVLAGESDSAIGNVINIGSGEEISIRDLILLIHKETQSSSEVQIGALANRPTEIWRMFADRERAEKLLGWKPKYSFLEGLKITIEWYKKYLELYYGEMSGLWKLSQFSILET